MRAELAPRNDCAVTFLSRAVVNLCWYYCTFHSVIVLDKLINHFKDEYFATKELLTTEKLTNISLTNRLAKVSRYSSSNFLYHMLF